MVSLAEWVRQVSETLYGTPAQTTSAEKSTWTEDFSRSLEEWKNEMPQTYRFDMTSLKEPDSISKRKVVLKLRELHF